VAPVGDGCDELLAGYHGEVFVRSSKESFSAFGPKTMAKPRGGADKPALCVG
jgi:asparagine synthetase B (glutamine-hydrolysing)